LNRKEAAAIQSEIDTTSFNLSKAYDDAEMEMERGEGLYHEAVAQKTRVDAVLQEFDQQTANGGSPQGSLNMARVVERQGIRFVVNANGFPAHFTPEEIDEYGKQHGYQAHEYAQNDTWDTMHALRGVEDALKSGKTEIYSLGLEEVKRELGKLQSNSE
jgi:hypothetical protein